RQCHHLGGETEPAPATHQAVVNPILSTIHFSHMHFSSFFGLSNHKNKINHVEPSQVPVAPNASQEQVLAGPNNSDSNLPVLGPSRTHGDSLGPSRTKIVIPDRAWFLTTQARWVTDPSPLRIWEKSRQVGATITDALDSVLKASPADARFDVWVSSRDEIQSRLYLEDCVEWAKIL